LFVPSEDFGFFVSIAFFFGGCVHAIPAIPSRGTPANQEGFYPY
jgi:hypothetical protein